MLEALECLEMEQLLSRGRIPDGKPFVLGMAHQGHFTKPLFVPNEPVTKTLAKGCQATTAVVAMNTDKKPLRRTSVKTL